MGELPRLAPGIGEQDPAIEPTAYKIYAGLERIALPGEFPASDVLALNALVASGDLPEGRAVPDLETLARVCLRANGVLKRWRSPAGKEIEFRAAGCTGARYHLELYLFSGDLPGLDAGIYHYGAHDHGLRRLRDGDYRAAVIAATGEEPAVAAAPVVAVVTSTFWRNAWRYQARTYRHVYWDTGTVLANLLAVAADAHLPARVVLGFADDEINALLGVDGVREAAVSLVALGRAEDTPAAALEAAAARLTDPAGVGTRDRVSGDRRDARRLFTRFRRGVSGLARSRVRAAASFPEHSLDPLATARSGPVAGGPDRCRHRAPPLEPPL